MNIRPTNIVAQVIINIKKNNIHTFANDYATNNVHFVGEKIHSFILPKFFQLKESHFLKKCWPQNNCLSMDSKQGLLVDEMLEVRSEFLIKVA